MFTTRSRRRTDTSDEAQAGFSQRRSSLNPIKIGLVESDLLVREGLVALLNTVDDFECLGAWTRADEALTALPASPVLSLCSIDPARSSESPAIPAGSGIQQEPDRPAGRVEGAEHTVLSGTTLRWSPSSDPERTRYGSSQLSM